MKSWTLSAALGLLIAAVALFAQRTYQARARNAEREAQALRLSSPRAYPGYTLYAPLCSRTTYLVGLDGEVVHRWEGDHTPGASVHLLADGTLLRTCRVANAAFEGAAGLGGSIEQVDWEGRVQWKYVVSDERSVQHHDVEPLPNGNLLVLVWERKTREEALEAGADPERVGERGVLAEALIEVASVGSESPRVVWRWSAWDHLIQDRDPRRANYGDVARRPERIDLNPAPRMLGAPGPDSESLRAEETLERQMRATGYVGEAERAGADPAQEGTRSLLGAWLHVNSVSYDSQEDLIALSSRAFSEVWIVDHSTTPEESATSSGGRFGRGGDLLFRFGNPAAYRGGDEGERSDGKRDAFRLYRPHDATFLRVEDGALHVLVFNNGDLVERPFSSVEEVALPFRAAAGFESTTAAVDSVWSYSAPDAGFFALTLSSAQRLPNGNTLVCDGPGGRIIELDQLGEAVWDYVIPHGGPAPDSPGTHATSVFQAARIPFDHPGLLDRLRPPGF